MRVRIGRATAKLLSVHGWPVYATARRLESIRDWDMGGVDISYGPNDHTGSEYVELTIIGQDGKFRR